MNECSGAGCTKWGEAGRRGWVRAWWRWCDQCLDQDEHVKWNGINQWAMLNEGDEWVGGSGMVGWMDGWINREINRFSYMCSPFLCYPLSPRSIISHWPSFASRLRTGPSPIFSHNTLPSLLSYYCPSLFLLSILHPDSPPYISMNFPWLHPI